MVVLTKECCVYDIRAPKLQAMSVNQNARAQNYPCASAKCGHFFEYGDEYRLHAFVMHDQPYSCGLITDSASQVGLDSTLDPQSAISVKAGASGIDTVQLTQPQTMEADGTPEVFYKLQGVPTGLHSVTAVIHSFEEDITEELVRRGVRYDQCNGNTKLIREWEKDMKALLTWQTRTANAPNPKEGTPAHQALQREMVLVEPILMLRKYLMNEDTGKWWREVIQREREPRLDKV